MNVHTVGVEAVGGVSSTLSLVLRLAGSGCLTTGVGRLWGPVLRT